MLWKFSDPRLEFLLSPAAGSDKLDLLYNVRPQGVPSVIECHRMAYFLAKTDPETYSIDNLEREKKTTWDGVTNPQAVRAIREMHPGDKVFVYHSGGVSGVVGM